MLKYIVLPVPLFIFRSETHLTPPSLQGILKSQKVLKLLVDS